MDTSQRPPGLYRAADVEFVPYGAGLGVTSTTTALDMFPVGPQAAVPHLWLPVFQVTEWQEDPQPGGSLSGKGPSQGLVWDQRHCSREGQPHALGSRRQAPQLPPGFWAASQGRPGGHVINSVLATVLSTATCSLEFCCTPVACRHALLFLPSAQRVSGEPKCLRPHPAVRGGPTACAAWGVVRSAYTLRVRQTPVGGGVRVCAV